MAELAFYYVRWHYSQALLDLAGIVRNFLWFFYEFFSIPTLLRTLLVPFHRLDEQKKKGFDPTAWAETALVNTLMRLVGLVLRLMLILFGLFMMLSTLVFGFVFFILWLFVPLWLIVALWLGVTFLA